MRFGPIILLVSTCIGCHLLVDYQSERQAAGDADLFTPQPHDVGVSEAATDVTTDVVADIPIDSKPPQVPRFGEATLVPGINSPDTYDDGPHLSRDGLRLYFSSDRGGDRDIYVATRKSTDDDGFGVPVRLPGPINTSQDEADATLSEDELTIVFERDMGSRKDLFITSRSSLQAPFGEAVLMTTINSSSDDQDPGLSPDGLELLFLSNRGGSEDIWRATRTGNDVDFKPPVLLENISTTSFVEWDPALAGVSYLVFTSAERPDAIGSTDLYMAIREHKDAPFATPVLLETVSTPAFEAEVFYHDRLKLLIFCRKGPDEDFEMVWSKAQP